VDLKGRKTSWRKLHDNELRGLCSSTNIMMIKSRRMRWAEHAARMGRGEVFTGFWLEGPKGRDQWEDQSVGERTSERITLRWT
jgi:hypothetical protein